MSEICFVKSYFIFATIFRIHTFTGDQKSMVNRLFPKKGDPFPSKGPLKETKVCSLLFPSVYCRSLVCVLILVSVPLPVPVHVLVPVLVLERVLVLVLVLHIL